MDDGPPDPDIQDGSAGPDNMLTYDDAMDALIASDLTGQSTVMTPKTRPTLPKTLDKVVISSQALTGPALNTPATLEGVLVQRLLDISKAALVPKTKWAKLVYVDVESAANILVIAGLIWEQASIIEARHVVFDPSCSTTTAPTPSSLAPNAQFKLRSKSLLEKVNTLADQVAKKKILKFSIFFFRSVER
ncbi:hypothetical protein DFH28DRAFT_924865 [Melampsora americana]|nr:hypothetical protein DFH28DRAFT_924865 [Melampsora americana]